MIVLQEKYHQQNYIIKKNHSRVLVVICRSLKETIDFVPIVDFL
jgi:hypothetical protein